MRHSQKNPSIFILIFVFTYGNNLSDVGYSSNFEIYLTRNNGVQIVTNELSLTILREMRYREISPSDIAMALNLPKSTIQASITKLLRTGIVTQEKRVNDARSVIYRIDASIVFCSDTDVEWQLYARLASTTRIMEEGRCTSREDLSLYGASLTESGLNIVQGLFNIGTALTYGSNGRKFLDEMLSTMKDQSSNYGINVDMVTKDGLELKFESTSGNISDIPMIVVPMLGSIISHSKELLGYNLSHDVSLKVTNKGHNVVMKVDPFIGQEYSSGLEMFGSRTMKNYNVIDPFSIYSINGVSTLFTNPTMMGVLFNLSNEDMSVNDLEDDMGVSKATIYASLMKLVEMGAVEVDRDSGSPKKYRLLADPILYCIETESRSCDKLNQIVERFQSGQIDYYSAVIAYAMETIRCMGVRFDKMFTKSGGSTARTVINISQDMNPQKLLDIACSMVSVPDKAEVVTMIPLKVRVTMSPDSLWENWPADFVKGFILEGLKILTGDNYKIEMETVHASK